MTVYTVDTHSLFFIILYIILIYTMFPTMSFVNCTTLTNKFTLAIEPRVMVNIACLLLGSNPINNSIWVWRQNCLNIFWLICSLRSNISLFLIYIMVFYGSFFCSTLYFLFIKVFYLFLSNFFMKLNLTWCDIIIQTVQIINIYLL